MMHLRRVRDWWCGGHDVLATPSKSTAICLVSHFATANLSRAVEFTPPTAGGGGGKIFRNIPVAILTVFVGEKRRENVSVRWESRRDRESTKEM